MISECSYILGRGILHSNSERIHTGDEMVVPKHLQKLWYPEVGRAVFVMRLALQFAGRGSPAGEL
jgi:hypothetical protein